MKTIKTIIALLIAVTGYSQSITSLDVSETFNNQLAYVKAIYNTLDTAETVELNGIVYNTFVRDSSISYKVIEFCNKFKKDSIIVNKLRVNGTELHITKLLTHEYMATKDYSKNKKVRKSKEELKNISSLLTNHTEYLIKGDIKNTHKQGRLTFKGRCKKFDLDSRGKAETLTRFKNPKGTFNKNVAINRLLISYLEFHKRTGHWKCLIAEENSAITSCLSYNDNIFVLINYIEIDGRKVYDNYYKSNLK
jgi:hypothetical protein